MKYPATEKLEIIRLVEESRLPVRRMLEKLGVSKSAFYRWYDLYARFGEQGLEDRRSGPGRVWNRIPDDVRKDVLDMALDRLAAQRCCGNNHGRALRRSSGVGVIEKPTPARIGHPHSS